MMTDTKIKFGKQINYEGRPAYLVVEIRTPSEQMNHYGISSSIYNSYLSRARGADIIAGGQCVEAIAEAYPEIGEWHRKVHLANGTTGEPMHAEANGWYFLSDKGDIAAACRALRAEEIPADILDKLEEGNTEAAEKAFKRWVDKTLRPMWKANLEAFEEFLDDLEYQMEYEDQEEITTDELVSYLEQHKPGPYDDNRDYYTELVDDIRSEGLTNIDEAIAFAEDVSDDHSRADGRVETSTRTLWEWAADNQDSVEEALSEFGWEGVGESITGAFQMGQYLYHRQQYYEAAKLLQELLDELRDELEAAALED